MKQDVPVLYGEIQMPELLRWHAVHASSPPTEHTPPCTHTQHTPLVHPCVHPAQDTPNNQYASNESKRILLNIILNIQT